MATRHSPTQAMPGQMESGKLYVKFSYSLCVCVLVENGKTLAVTEQPAATVTATATALAAFGDVVNVLGD